MTHIWTYDYKGGRYRLIKDHKSVAGIYAEEKSAIGDMCQLLSKMQYSHDDLLEAAKALVGHLDKMEEGKWLLNRPGEMLIEAIAKATE